MAVYGRDKPIKAVNDNAPHMWQSGGSSPTAQAAGPAGGWDGPSAVKPFASRAARPALWLLILPAPLPLIQIIFSETRYIQNDFTKYPLRCQYRAARYFPLSRLFPPRGLRGAQGHGTMVGTSRQNERSGAPWTGSSVKRGPWPLNGWEKGDERPSI